MTFDLITQENLKKKFFLIDKCQQNDNVMIQTPLI